MSGSGDGIKVTITGDAAEFVAATKTASDAAQNLSSALGRTSISYRDIQGAMGGAAASSANLNAALAALMASGAGIADTTQRTSGAVIGAAAAARQGSVSLREFSAAGLTVQNAMKSAGEAADVFMKVLNPTPAALLRRLMGDELPAAFRMTQTATQATIETLLGMNAAAKSAAASADAFTKAVNPTPLQAFRSAIAEMASGNKVASSSIDALIETATGLNAPFKSAADSARAFLAALNPSPLQTLRTLMSDDIPTAAQATAVTFQAVIDAAIGVGRAFKSAEDSAAVFNKALNPTPLQTLRDLMQTDVPKAAKQTATDFQAVIDASTGVDRAFKSAADSADVFSREVTRIPMAQLRAQLQTELPAAAKATVVNFQEVIDATMMMGRSFKSAEESARVFEQALDPTPLAKMRTLMADEIPAASGHAATGFAGITREIFVLGHEAMTGNFTRIPGSLMVLAERTGGLMTAIGNLASSFTFMGGVALGVVTSVGIAIGAIVARTIEGINAIRRAGNEAVLLGQNVAQAREQVADLNKSLQGIGIGQTEALKVAAGLQTLTGATGEQKRQLADLATGMALALGITPEKATEQLVAALEKGGSGVTALMDKYHLWDRENGLLQRSNIKVAEATHDSGAMMGATIDALSARFPEYLAQLKEFREKNKGGADFEFESGPAQKMALPEAPQRAEDPAVAQQREQTAEHTTELTRQLKLTSDLTAAQAQLASAGTEAQRQIAAEAVRAIEVEIALQKNRGDSSWVQKVGAQAKEAADAAVRAAYAGHQSQRQMAEAEARAEIDVYRQAMTEKGHTNTEYQAMQTAMARLDMSLMKEEAGGAAQAAKEALAAKLATLSEEQAANHDNFEKVMAIEQQKIALLRAAGASETKQLEDELAKQDNLRRQHAMQVAQIANEGLAKQREADSAAYAEKKSTLDAEVSEGQIGKQKEIAQLRAFAAEQHAVELQALQAYIATVQDQPKALAAALDEMTVLKQKWAAQDRKLNAEAVADSKASWDKMAAPVESAISGQVSAVLRGTETIGQAFAKMAANVVTSYATMAVQAGLKWAAGQAFQLVQTALGESQKTAAAAAGATARAGIATTETATENAGLLVRVARWLAGELGLTAATTAQSTARTAAQSAASAAAMAAQGATNVAEGLSYAAVGGAAAGASVAAIPVVGWAMAPGVAAETYAMLAGYASAASLDVGAWKLPADMPANLHAGEMVVPANFAEGMRGALSGSGSGGGQTLNYAPKVSGGSGADLAGAMRAQSQQFKSYLWHATRNGALALPVRR